MAELIYKQLKKDLEQKAIVAADPATTAMVVTKSEFTSYKNQTEQTLQTMKDATTKAQTTVDNVIQGHTPLKGVVVYRDDIADNNGIAITENQDSNLAIYKVNEDGSASDVKLLLNNKEVAMKEDLEDFVSKDDLTYFDAEHISTSELTIGSSVTPQINNLQMRWASDTDAPLLITNKDYVFLQVKTGNKSPIATTDFVEKRIQQIPKPDLSNYVTFSGANTFTANNTFQQTINADNGINVARSIDILEDGGFLKVQSGGRYLRFNLNAPTDANDIVNKQYVDNQIAANSSVNIKTLSSSSVVSFSALKGQLTINNSNLASSATRNNVMIRVEDSVGGVYVVYKIASSGSNTTFSIYQINGNKDISTSASISYRIFYW